MNPPVARSSDTKPGTASDARDESRNVQVRDAGLLSRYLRLPLILGEDADTYDALRARVIAGVQPRDPIEELLALDMVNLAWEAHRHRQMRASLLMAAARTILSDKLRRAVQVSGNPAPDEGVDSMTRRCLQGDPAALSAVGDLLAALATDFHTIMAGVYASKLSEVERIDRLIASADERRNRALAAIDRRRVVIISRVPAGIEHKEHKREDARLEAPRMTMSSVKQVTANRANAQRSTGPRTD